MILSNKNAHQLNSLPNNDDLMPFQISENNDNNNDK